MKGKKALILASLMLLVSPTVTGSREPSIPKAIDPELFQSVILPKEAKATSFPQILEPLKREYKKPKFTPLDNTAKVIIPQPVFVVGNHSVSGKASWYCRVGRSICRAGYPDTAGADYYAAAGPLLRIAFGRVESSRAYVGKMVLVCNGKRCVNVRLVDWCQCHYKTSIEKVIDLYKDAWDKIVGDGMGKVTVSW